jgi:hypothetical protein
MDDIKELIEDCMAREERLNEWEANFIQSISEQFADTEKLSAKQYETLNKIWDKVTAKG